MAEPSTYQSLYRRYRSQRFDQVLGQDHVTKALRNAVRDGRVGHAYLFSGPRGTGKTSTARILAKVLNCAAPEDGEPCGKCDNCLAVEHGQDTDWLLEQDAASKSKVDDMRDLLDRVPLGTSGNRKVIILDEVHMLSQGAENALLKTLEEPPSHVVFVLATTDPQKVRPTIRSRTQHFEFHLLPASVLADHVRWVINDAQLQLPADDMDRIVDHVVRAGGGSARDTLSALDQVAALGEVSSAAQPVDSILDALAAQDAGAVLAAVADATVTGREPRALGEAIIVRLRDAFLAVLGAAGDHLPPAERERALHLGKQMGPARLTRALDVLGEALTELARKPDPRIVVEVALVRLAQPEADSSVAALVARIEALERALQKGAVAAPPADAGSTAPEPQPVHESQSPAPPTPEATAPPPSRGAGAGADAARAALAAQRGDTSPSEAPSSTQAASGSAEGQPGARSKPTLGSVASRPGGSAAPEAPPSNPGPSNSQPSSTEPPTLSVVPDEPPHPADQQEPVPAASGSDSAPAPDEPASPEPASSQAGAELPSLSQLQGMWDNALPQLPVKVRSKWRGGRWHDVAGGEALFAVPNQWHQKACEEGQQVVEKVLAEQVGTRVPVKVIVEGEGPQGPGSAGGGGSPDGQGGARSPARGGGGGPGGPPTKGPDAGGSLSSNDDIHVAEIAELRDAGDVATGGIDLLMREFGGELIDVDPNQAR